MSWDELLALALGESDNAAADVLLKRAGGPQAVTRHMGELGIRGVNVSRSEGAIAMALAGVDPPPLPEARWSKQLFDSLDAAANKKTRQAAAERYAGDPRDTATPSGIAQLFVVLQRGEALNQTNTAKLLRIMRESQTGVNRIRALLPKGTPVADKTGTIAGTTNDVGVIELPDSRGHVVVAVLIKSSKAKLETRERVIAQIARELYARLSVDRVRRKMPPP